MITEILVAVAIGVLAFMVFMAVWYLMILPNKRKGLLEEARKASEKETEVLKQKKLLEVKEKFLSKKAELEKEVRRSYISLV